MEGGVYCSVEKKARLGNELGELVNAAVFDEEGVGAMQKRLENTDPQFAGVQGVVAEHGLIKGAGLKIDFFKPPRFRCFGVPFPSIGPAKGPYEVTALIST